jgi:adenylate cyclase
MWPAPTGRVDGLPRPSELGRDLSATFAPVVRVGTFTRVIAYPRHRAALRQQERRLFDTDLAIARPQTDRIQFPRRIPHPVTRADEERRVRWMMSCWSLVGRGRARLGLTEHEVAERTGSTPERVRALVKLGVLVPGPDSEQPYVDGDALRVKLVQELEESGISPTEIAEALSRGALSLSYLDRFPGPSVRSDQTYAELCDEIGIPFTLLDSVYIGFGLSSPRPDEQVRTDDRDIIAELPFLLQVGLGEAEVLRASRVWGDGPRRVAEHQVYEFHELIEDPFRKKGLSNDQALDAALTQVGVRIIPYLERLAAWLYRRHFEAYSTQHRVEHVEAALDAAGLHRMHPSHPEACVFADLSGYTRLTEELGDAAAAQMAIGLSELMQEVASRHKGRAVKLIGDAAHFYFHEPSDAVLGALAFVEEVEPRGLPPAHVGVNAGPMTYTDGDYYGLAVNIAARIAAIAGPGQVLVGEVAATAADPEEVRFERIGTAQLKGVTRPVMIYRALRQKAP